MIVDWESNPCVKDHLSIDEYVPPFKSQRKMLSDPSKLGTPTDKFLVCEATIRHPHVLTLNKSMFPFVTRYVLSVSMNDDSAIHPMARLLNIQPGTG